MRVTSLEMQAKRKSTRMFSILSDFGFEIGELLFKAEMVRSITVRDL